MVMGKAVEFSGIGERRSKRIIPYVKGGKIVELGCGTGATLSILSKAFPRSIIVGVDHNMDCLEVVNRRRLENVIAMKGDITQNIFPSSSFDTVIFKFSLHEVYSSNGNEGVNKALRNAYEILKDDGVLIIYELLKPNPRKVEFRIKQDAYKVRFERFVEEFAPRKVKYEMKGEWISLDISDCLEFLTKYGASRWKEEMREEHFFYTEEDFKQVLMNAGFNIVHVRKYGFERDVWREKTFIFNVKFGNPKCYILIVARKV
jgi:ubiquinone/menaquinone biosynthesis C-methylase UbiE